MQTAGPSIRPSCWAVPDRPSALLRAMIPNRLSPKPMPAVSNGIPAAASAPKVMAGMTASTARLYSTAVSEAWGDSAPPPIPTVRPASRPSWAASCRAFVVAAVRLSGTTV
jgi:hypothetical protein